MLQEKKSSYPSNAFGRFWMKVPLILRSVLIGFGVSSVGVGIWVLLVSNTPLPWSVAAMGAILILYWMYFRGRWKPSNTQAFRRKSMRLTQLKRPVWIWGLVAALFIFLFVQSGWILTFRIYEFQPEVFKTSSYLNDFPGWMPLL